MEEDVVFLYAENSAFGEWGESETVGLLTLFQLGEAVEGAQIGSLDARLFIALSNFEFSLEEDV
jgi:hypothetical protein